MQAKSMESKCKPGIHTSKCLGKRLLHTYPLFGLPIHVVLNLLKLLYGLIEPGESWFHKYKSFP